MKTIVKWLNNPVVITVLLVTGTVSDLVLVGRAYDLSKSDWASWVQAVGSIVAICASFYFFARQRKVEQKDARDRLLFEDYQSAQVLENIAMACGGAADAVVQAWKAQDGLPAAIARLDELRSLMHGAVQPSHGVGLHHRVLAVDLQTVEIKAICAHPYSDEKSAKVDAAVSLLGHWLSAIVGDVTMKREQLEQRRIRPRL